MEKNIQIGMLYEFYGKLLTEKQAFVIDSYYNNDLSLSEIADEIGITRQGVQKQIKDAEKFLIDCENKLGFVNEFYLNEKRFNKVEELLSKVITKENRNDIDKVLAIIKKMI